MSTRKSSIASTLGALSLATFVWCAVSAPCPAGAEDPLYTPHKLPGELGKTWAEIDGEVYGAKPDKTGPIGGGEGYTRIVTSGDTTVTNAAELIEALQKAQPGQTVCIPDETEIELSVRVRSEDFVLKIPEGVTLAGNRGANGSQGALIYSDEFKTGPMIQPEGPNVRVTGLRLRGPDPKLRMDLHKRCFSKGGPGHKLYYKFPTSDGIICDFDGLEIDNCQIYGWSHAAIYLRKGREHRVHHNHIHHNQRHGLGYGVSHNTSSSVIEYNLFDNCRHAVAGTGRPGNSYEARHNVVLERANGHLFDMHGGRDRKDGTDIAGSLMNIHHNTFTATHVPAVLIRGLPEEIAQIHHNWFYLPEPGKRVIGSDGRTSVHDNVYGPDAEKKEEKYPFEE